MCCNRPRPGKVGPLPSSGASVAGQGGNQTNEARRQCAFLRPALNATPRNQPGCACNPGTTVWIKHHGPYYMMRSAGLVGCHRHRRRGLTSRDPQAAPPPDLVGRRFTADQPDRVWAADITYVPT
jgi:hypothetical protein